MTVQSGKGQPLIHVGLPKAGSTYLKRSVLAVLSDAIVVPRGTMLRALLQRDADPRRVHDMITAEAAKQIQRTGVATSSVGGMVISSERLSGSFLSCDDAETIGANLAASFPRATILLVTRRAKDYIRSVYKFELTQGRPMPLFAEFVERNEESLLRKVSYRELIERYVDLFGRERVIVVKFEELRSGWGELQKVLMSRCGMTVRRDPPERRRNKSLDGPALESVRQLNRYTWPLVGTERRIRRVFTPEHYGLRESSEYGRIQPWINMLVASLASGSRSASLDLPSNLDRKVTEIESDNDKVLMQYGLSLAVDSNSRAQGGSE